MKVAAVDIPMTKARFEAIDSSLEPRGGLSAGWLFEKRDRPAGPLIIRSIVLKGNSMDHANDFEAQSPVIDCGVASTETRGNFMYLLYEFSPPPFDKMIFT